MPRPISNSSNTDIIIICFGLFVVIMVAMMFGSSGLEPSSGFGGKGLDQYPYEGFEQAMDYFHGRNEAFDLMSSEYSSSEDSSSESAPKKVEGFAGIQSGPVDENNGLMGFLGPNAAKTDCPGYGYTKSTGNVCMSKGDIKLLTTRGGNAV